MPQYKFNFNKCSRVKFKVIYLAVQIIRQYFILISIVSALSDVSTLKEITKQNKTDIKPLPATGSFKSQQILLDNKRSSIKGSFTVRAVRNLNRFPRDVVDAPSLETFRVRLDKAHSNLI